MKRKPRGKRAPGKVKRARKDILEWKWPNDGRVIFDGRPAIRLVPFSLVLGKGKKSLAKLVPVPKSKLKKSGLPEAIYLKLDRKS